MKQLFQLILTALILTTLFYKCANPGRPTGGPKDTIPPTLLSSIPVHGATNFNGSTLTLEFSEYINADKLKQELIITPKTNIRFKHVVKKNRLIIKLEDPLDDSTTYYFNFAQGVTDITEKNPAINLALAFSTGPTIDSMSIAGTVEDLLTKEKSKGYLVGLYPDTDTLDYFKDTPLYFTTTNDSGIYRMNYLKKANYRILAFYDENGNITLDPEKEAHAFLSKTITPDTLTNLPVLRSILQNIKPLSLINIRPTGRYAEAKFNKQVDNYSLDSLMLPSNIIGENKDVIRIYKTNNIAYNDTIRSILHAWDSLGNEVHDTLKYVFLESNRKPAGFAHQAPKEIELKDNFSFDIQFNKPIESWSPDSIAILSDSIFHYKPEISYTWNPNRTLLKINTQIIGDSLYNLFERSIPKDTIKMDSTNQNNLSRQTNHAHSLDLYISPGTFISVESDSSKTIKIPIKKPRPQAFGTFKLTVNTDKPSYMLQLLNTKGQVKFKSHIPTQILSIHIKPDTYQIRILIDENQNGKYDYGNLLRNEEPEPVFLYPELISIRENWVVELSISF